MQQKKCFYNLTYVDKKRVRGRLWSAVMIIKAVLFTLYSLERLRSPVVLFSQFALAS